MYDKLSENDLMQNLCSMFKHHFLHISIWVVYIFFVSFSHISFSHYQFHRIRIKVKSSPFIALLFIIVSNKSIYVCTSFSTVFFSFSLALTHNCCSFFYFRNNKTATYANVSCTHNFKWRKWLQGKRNLNI